MRKLLVSIVSIIIVSVLTSGKPGAVTQTTKVENVIERLFMQKLNDNPGRVGYVKEILRRIRDSHVVDSILSLSPDTIYGRSSLADWGGIYIYVG